MNHDLDAERIVDACSPSFTKRIVTLAPGGVLVYDEPSWHGAIVFVTAGEIELEGLSGSVLRLCCGDILWLAPLPLRAVRNAGLVQARLLAVSRRAPANAVALYPS